MAEAFEVAAAEAAPGREENEVRAQFDLQLVEQRGQRREGREREGVFRDAHAGDAVGLDGDRVVDGFIEDGVRVGDEQDVARAVRAGQDAGAVAHRVPRAVEQAAFAPAQQQRVHARRLAERGRGNFADEHEVRQQLFAQGLRRADAVRQATQQLRRRRRIWFGVRHAE